LLRFKKRKGKIKIMKKLIVVLFLLVGISVFGSCRDVLRKK